MENSDNGRHRFDNVRCLRLRANLPSSSTPESEAQHTARTRASWDWLVQKAPAFTLCVCYVHKRSRSRYDGVAFIHHRLRIMPRLIYSNTGLYVAQDANASATVRCLVQIQSTRPMYAYLINALGDPLRSNVYSRNNLGRDFRNTQGCTCKVHWTNPTPT